MCATIKVSAINSINFLCSTIPVHVYIYIVDEADEPIFLDAED